MTANGLILLFGMPRSGTTWLGKIFDSHPDTLYRHEPDSGPNPLREVPLFALPEDAERYCGAVERFLEHMAASRSSRVAGKLPVFPKRYLPTWRQQLIKGSITLSKVAGRAGLDLDILGPGPAAGQAVTVWKSIESLGRLGLLQRCLPGAHPVIILRHACGTIASVKRGEAAHRFGDLKPSAEDAELYRMLGETPQGQRRGLDLAGFTAMSPLERLAWRWVLVNEKALEESADHAQTLVLRYEDLCQAPLAQGRRLLEHCGLPWNEQTEGFLNASISTDSSRYYSVFKDPLKSANKWRSEMTEAEIQTVLDIIRDTAPGRLFDQDDAAAASACG